MSRWRAAERHLLAALDCHERMQSPTWVAISEHALAKMLWSAGTRTTGSGWRS